MRFYIVFGVYNYIIPTVPYFLGLVQDPVTGNIVER